MSILENKASNKTKFEFSQADIIAVNHFLFWNNKTEAYKLTRLQDQTSANQKSLRTMAGTYFNSERIKLLLNIEREKFIARLFNLIELYELKIPTSQDIIASDISRLDELNDISKEQAIKIITKALLNAKTDPKTIKDLIPNLMRLNSWDKETDQDSSNIVTYHLPV